MEQKFIEIKVIDMEDGTREIAIYFPEVDQMVVLHPEAAKLMAFSLMECSDAIVPPFEESFNRRELDDYADLDDEDLL